MSWTYNSGLQTDVDRVRFMVQDTNCDRKIFQDEEISFVVSEEANIYMASARLCDIMVTRAGNVKSKKIGELSLTYDTQFYISLGSQLRSRGLSHQMPYAGGISVSDKASQRDNSDATDPSFVRHLDDNPAAPAPQVPPNNPMTQI